MSADTRAERLRAALEAALHPTLLEDPRRQRQTRPATPARAKAAISTSSSRRAGFAGVPALERHRMVYAAAAELMGRDIHALSIDARSP